MKIATRLPSERGLCQQDADRIADIRGQLIEVGDRWRARHSWLDAHQNTVGLALFLVAIAGVLLDAGLYVAGAMPWWLCIPVTALWLSILHEIEHDLIHRMYFRNRSLPHNLMMFGVWFFRPSTINPWLRRRLHLHHHKVSGTDSDIEERTLTNGEAWGGHRLLVLLDSLIGIYVRPWRIRAIGRAYVEAVTSNEEEAKALANELRRSYFPLGLVHYSLWHAFLGIHLANLLGADIGGEWLSVLDTMAVVLLAPNAFRTFCLHFVSSNMHYHGDVEAGNVMQQVQVWTSRWLWPVHAFCFNFGGTHAIHHFLVRDPFYLREATSRESQQILRAGGVRFDDYRTFARANRFGLGEVAFGGGHPD